MKITEILKTIDELEKYMDEELCEIDQFSQLDGTFEICYKDLEKIRKGILSLPEEYPGLEPELEASEELMELERRIEEEEWK